MENNRRLIQNILKSQYPQLQKKKHPVKDHKALQALMYCQTEEQGYNNQGRNTDFSNIV